GSRAVQSVPCWNGQKSADTPGSYGGAALSSTSASRLLMNRVWPYSLNRQQRPLATHTGPAAATSRSASASSSRTLRRSSVPIHSPAAVFLASLPRKRGEEELPPLTREARSSARWR